MLDLAQIREDFQQNDNQIYFNAGLVGFPSRTVLANTLAFYQRSFYRSESEYFALGDELNKKWAATAPRFINCAPDEVTGIPNTTTGMNLLTQAIPWQPGDNVVICELEFLSEYIAFQHFRQQYGFEVRVARRDGWGVPVENIIALIDGRTRLVALSHVAFVNGYRHDIRAIATAAHDRGALIAIDAIQSLGPLVVDVQALAVDFLVAGSSKWFLSLPGWGILFARKELIPRLGQPIGSFLALDDPARAIDDWCNSMDFVQPYAMTNDRIDKFRMSTENLLGKIALVLSMENFLTLGQADIENHVLDLSGYLMLRLQEHGHPVRSVRERVHRSGIVNFLPRQETPDLQSRLEKQRIHLSRRGGGYRVSLHVYNTRDEVDRLLETLEKILES